MVDNNHPTYYTLVHHAQALLPEREDLCQRLLCDRLEWTVTDWIMNMHDVAEPAHIQQYQHDVSRLVNGEPLQYIIGHEWFYGRCFKVTSDTLIPRPETELLVEKVLQALHHKTHARILDIGTGTGAIGVTLKCERPLDDVTLSDISSHALAVARENAMLLEVDVTCVESDVFDAIPAQQFDCIVSNPPYIAHAEVPLMDASVLQYEPHTALFAENNGLAIYEKIAKGCEAYLKPDGVIALEIGYQQAEAVVRMFQEAMPAAHIHVYQDYAELDRMIIVERK